MHALSGELEGVRSNHVFCMSPGQNIHAKHRERVEAISNGTAPWKRFLIQQQRLIAFVIPAVTIHFLWWSMMISRNLFHYFEEKYPMAIVMVFGSLVAGKYPASDNLLKRKVVVPSQASLIRCSVGNRSG